MYYSLGLNMFEAYLPLRSFQRMRAAEEEKDGMHPNALLKLS